MAVISLNCTKKHYYSRAETDSMQVELQLNMMGGLLG